MDNKKKYHFNPNVTNTLLDNNSDLFKVYKFDNKIRLGPDSGCVIGHLDINYDCYISAGISENDDFILEFMKKYNIPKEKTFYFDGTIENIPSNLQDKVTFYKKNISYTNTDITSNLTHYCEMYDKIFLKMDIEGCEWEWLSFMDENKLNKFVEIIIEFHGFTNASCHNQFTMHDFNCSYIQKLKCIEKLNKTHYLIHAHGNNYDVVSNNGLPNVMEFVYINKNQFAGIPELNQETLPIKGLDFPNNKYCPDIDLNFYPFVHEKTNPFLIDIVDKYEYTTEDYINIQEQLNKKNIDSILENLYDTQKDKFYNFDDLKTRITRGIRQVIIDPSNNLLPMKKLYKIGNGGDQRNCFVSCTPFITNNNQNNTRFIASQQIVKSLEEVGFNGYFYLLNGGFPNPTGIEMKYVGVPYCFKIFIMLEAHKMGFENIIWLDSACYTLKNPQHLFDILQEDKLLYTKSFNNNYDSMIFPEILQLINKITNNDIHNSKFIQTIVFGLNFESDIIKKIVKEYYEMVDIGWPFFSIFPEECVLTSLINKPEYNILFKNDDNPEKYRIQIHETNIDENTAKNCGFYFHHRNYSRYNDKQVLDITPSVKENVFPMSFSIPDECVVDRIPQKTSFLASLIPGDMSTYIFDKYKEKEYNEMYRRSRFALTKMKGGWDCLRHYEILMNGCIPLFENLKECPAYTLTTYPKEFNDAAYDLYNNWIENDVCIEKYNVLCGKILSHTKNNCTASASAKYFLKNIKNGDNIKNILLITCHHGINYLRESLWIGLKKYIKSINGVAVEYDKMPFLYEDFDNCSENKYYTNNCFTYPKRLEKDEHYYMSENEIVEKINSNFWDLIIYGKVGPDEYCTFPYFDVVKEKYTKDKIAFLFGGDEIFNFKNTDNNSYHINMFNVPIYYKPYVDYVNHYKQFGSCFIRELEK